MSSNQHAFYVSRILLTGRKETTKVTNQTTASGTSIRSISIKSVVHINSALVFTRVLFRLAVLYLHFIMIFIALVALFHFFDL